MIVTLEVCLELEFDNDINDVNANVYDKMKELMSILAKVKSRINELDNQSKNLKDELSTLRANKILNDDLM